MFTRFKKCSELNSLCQRPLVGTLSLFGRRGNANAEPVQHRPKLVPKLQFSKQRGLKFTLIRTREIRVTEQGQALFAAPPADIDEPVQVSGMIH